MINCIFNYYSLDNTNTINISACGGINKTSDNTDNDEQTRPSSNTSSELDSNSSSGITRYLL